jgi:Zn-dependent protease
VPLEVFLLLAPIVLVSLTLHELAHAWVAWKLGDPTARDQGRLTLNPLAHLDPLGTLMFAISALFVGVAFGWARPVPVMPGYFRRPKEGMAVVAAAGPVMNFLCAVACYAVYRHVALGDLAEDVVYNAFFVNVILGFFNLIPVPPLDGSRIVGVFMDRATYARWIELDLIGMFIVLGTFLVFRNEFTRLLLDAVDDIERFMDVLVLA